VLLVYVFTISHFLSLF